MRRIVSYLSLPCLFFLMSNNGASEISPNIVLMMADDMGMGDTSAFQDITGNPDGQQIHTPHMDRLAHMGVRFTDAHTPTSRCTGTRYGLLTGRYPWRNRLKHWVLFGVQGDPMIERDRPTIASLLKDRGYSTAIVGKWHLGLRYRNSQGQPADAWADADLSQPLFDTPLDHGFDYCRFTSRSHGTSGTVTGGKKKNGPKQSAGPGHIHGRLAVSATGNGKQLRETQDSNAYVLSKLGGRHSDHSIDFLKNHLDGGESAQPFFLYYASNSNHSPYTPETEIDGKPVLGAARSVAGTRMASWKNQKQKTRSTTPANDLRHDFIHENDVVLGRLMKYLENTDDPRRSGHPLIENTIVIFTSDNGAERNADYATGPFRSHKGSAFEGGHRVPFIVAWPHGNVGDGHANTPGKTNPSLIGLQDMFATFAEATGQPLSQSLEVDPVKGGEDSISVLTAWRGEHLKPRPLFHNDHSEAKDHAAVAIRIDDVVADNIRYPGQWKLFFDDQLLRRGVANSTELYDLATDPQEQENRIDEANLQPVVDELTRQAVLHRISGGHRLAAIVQDHPQIEFRWSEQVPTPTKDVVAEDLREAFASATTQGVKISATAAHTDVEMQVAAMRGDHVIDDQEFHLNERGLGIGGGKVGQVDDGEAIVIRFDRDVLVESASIVAGNGQVGGFYQIGKGGRLAIYCVDGDIDAQDQSGMLSDIGFVKAGQPLRLDSSPHYDVEAHGRWRLQSIRVRLLEKK